MKNCLASAMVFWIAAMEVRSAEVSLTVSGHLRLIIGYHATAREILSSDTWGMGHEKEGLSAADAWTITHGL